MRIPYRKPGKDSLVKSDPMMTQGKLLELKMRLKKLQDMQPRAAADVARLAELGDFSENAEYQLAKGRLRGINNAMLSLGHQINQAQIIIKKDDGSVGLGNFVTVEKNGEIMTFQILGSTQTSPNRGIISHLSPIGSALLNRRVDDFIEIEINGNKIVMKIIEIK